MKLFLTSVFCFYQLVSLAQSEVERIKKFMDSLSMAGSNHIGESISSFKLKSTEGFLFTKASLTGKITFINFWFEACAPCIAEMNSLEQLYNDFKKYSKFQFLSITYEKPAAIEKVAAKYNMSYPVLPTSMDSCYYLNFGKGFPTTIITDENGKIIYLNVGGDINPKLVELHFKKELYPLLDRLLQ